MIIVGENMEGYGVIKENTFKIFSFIIPSRF